MTTELAHRSNRGRLPWGMLGMLVLVAAVEMLMARHDLDFTPVASFDWKLSGPRARREAPRSEILCFGDSLLKLGVAPRILEDRTGRRCCNLAIMLGVAPTDYFLMRRALQSGARPAALLVEFHPVLLGSTYQDGPHVRMLAELLSLRECWEFARTSRDVRLLGELLVNWLLPTFREREEVRHSVVEALKGRSSSHRAVNLSARRDWRINHGGQIMQRNPGFQESEVEKDQWRCLYNPWSTHPVNVAYVRRFLRMAARHEIPVYWIIPPYCPELRARRERAGVEAAYSRFARAIQAQFPNVTVLDARTSGFPRSAFIDPVHLDCQGTSTLSTHVADVLRDRLNAGHRGPRWVELPAYCERPGGRPL